MLVALSVVLVASILLGTRDGGAEPMIALASGAAASEIVEGSAEPDTVRTVGAGEIGADYRPLPELSPGWPFQPLPPVAKWEDPEPETDLARAHNPVQPQPVRPLAAPAPVVDRLPAAWLLAPLAVAASTGDSRHVSTVPEPSSLQLMATGILLLALRALFRRRGRPSPGRQHDR